MIILGISAFYHDSAAALLQNGKITAAAQEERFTRKKHDASFPQFAIKYCLKQANIALSQVDYVIFYDKPFLKFERLLETYLAYAPKGFKSFSRAIPIWVKEKIFQKDLIRKNLKNIESSFDPQNKLLFSEHHLSHAASAFYPSPFLNALIWTMDGVGEWSTTSVAIGQGHDLKIIKEIHFPHSLGLLYSAFTYHLGFKVNSGEYKVMGLAPYGIPEYQNTILENLIDVKSDGSYRLNMEYFDFCTGLKMTNHKFDELFQSTPRQPEELLTPHHMNLAASIQGAIEEVILKTAKSLSKEFPNENLCLAGGVALNCVANGRLKEAGYFKNIWIQPAAGDALGAALVAYHLYLQNPRIISNNKDSMQGSYLGPSFTQAEVESRLSNVGASYKVYKEEEIINKTAEALCEGKAVGWFQGRMEYGPRALGSRSILGDARSLTMQKDLNLKVKFRESFRPFAPAVLKEDVSNWFELIDESPYMLLVAKVKEAHHRKMTQEEEDLFGIEKLNIPRSSIPAVTHVDYSARVQTVCKETNPKFYSLLCKFKNYSGVPILINTSFNVRGEPIVCTPEDAFRCFMGSQIEILVIENCYLEKENQSKTLSLSYKDQFELD